jgi:hypothetical protein
MMSNRKYSAEEKKTRVKKPVTDERAKDRPNGEAASPLADLQQKVGNRAVQRLLAQRDGEGAMELDGETVERINQERSGGQPLDAVMERQASEAIGQDFSDVRVHDSPEANELNQQIGAKAFTTGRDIFFGEGSYQPHTNEGQELIAHELTHVVQQGSGKVSSAGGEGMAVNPPGDAFEQEADDVAKTVTAPGGEPMVQRQEELPEEELQAQSLQRHALEEEEVQTQLEEEEEEELVQPQELEEDEAVQAQEEEEYEAV